MTRTALLVEKYSSRFSSPSPMTVERPPRAPGRIRRLGHVYRRRRLRIRVLADEAVLFSAPSPEELQAHPLLDPLSNTL